MNSPFTRRNFLKTTGGAVALAAVSPNGFAQEKSPAKKLQIRKAIMFATVNMPGSVLEKCKAIKEAGFAGIEPMSHMDVEEVLKARDETGLEIPSVCCATHWAENLAHPNPATRDRGLAGLKQALQDAKKYGASSVLFVPCTVTKEISYADAYARSHEGIRKAIPLAEELGVKIAIENVWNNFLLSPLEMARYLDEFKSAFVKAHFDIGNILRYGWPEQWIPVLGQRIVQLHFKEYSREKMNSAGLWKGFDVKFLEGDNNWRAIMKTVREINYAGWAIAEQSGGNSLDGLKDLSARMDKILAS